MGAGLCLTSSYVSFPTLKNLFSYFLFNPSGFFFSFFKLCNFVSEGKRNKIELFVNPPSDERSFEMSSPAAVSLNRVLKIPLDLKLA